MNWYFQVLKKYADFSGRARRKEYWLFGLVNGIIISVLGLLGLFAGGPVIVGLYALAVVIPTIAVTIRRLHDTNRSGWYFLIILIPFIGGIVLIVFTVLDSTPGENQYGSNPKGVTA